MMLQLSAFAARYMSAVHVSGGAQLKASDLVCLGYFLCGMSPADVSMIPPAEYKYACTYNTNTSNNNINFYGWIHELMNTGQPVLLLKNVRPSLYALPRILVSQEYRYIL